MAGRFRRAFLRIFRRSRRSRSSESVQEETLSDPDEVHSPARNASVSPRHAIVFSASDSPPTDTRTEDDEKNIAKSIRLARQADWYWGPVNATVAEQVLSDKPDGTFLVRDSTDRNFLFSLSCKYEGKIGHIRIEYNRGSFTFRKIQHYKADNIKDFIEKAVEHSKTGQMQFMTRPRAGIGATRIHLLYPLCRRQTVPSLKHLARLVVLQNLANRDEIARLPVPLMVKKYLHQPQYFVDLSAETNPESSSTELV